MARYDFKCDKCGFETELSIPMDHRDKKFAHKETNNGELGIDKCGGTLIRSEINKNVIPIGFDRYGKSRMIK